VGNVTRPWPRSSVLSPEGASVQLARVLADEPDPHAALVTVCEIVCAHTRSDGAKVYVAVPHAASPHGAALIPLHRTNTSRKQHRAIPVGDVGLSDWVYRHDDWLLIKQGVPADRTGLDPERALTGRHDEVLVRARREQDVIGLAEGGRADDEKSMLFVPMHQRDRVVGVLAIWRDDHEEYDQSRDVPALMQLAPHAVSACLPALRLDVASRELRAMNELAAALQPETPLFEVHGAVLRAAADVAGAPAAVLFHHDPDRPGRLYATRSWAASEELAVSIQRLLRGACLDVGDNPARWASGVEEGISRRTVGAGPVLRLQHLLPFAANPQKGCAGAIGILSTPTDAPTLLPAENDSPLKSLLQYVSHVLHAHISVHAARLVEEMGFLPSERDFAGLLKLSAVKLGQAVGADAALVYVEDWDGWKLWNWSEPGPPPDILIRPKSPTFRGIEKKRVFRVSHTTDTMEPTVAQDLRELQPVAKALGSRSVESWICWAVVVGERRLGAIQLLTKTGGNVLSPEHANLGTVFLERAGIEIERVGRRLLLEDLNRLATELASLSGADLGERMPRALRLWTSRFLRPGCEVAVVAKTRDDILLLSARSDAIHEGLLPSLERLSAELGRSESIAAPGHRSLDVEEAYVAAAIRLAEGALKGHIFVFHPRRFSEGDLDVIREAAREMSVVLSGERYRHEFNEAAGRFRHALLGPVQGITQAARMLLDSAAAAGARDVDRHRARIDEEAEMIAFWRENQRLYLGGRAEVRPRPQPLKAVVDRCMDRFHFVFRARGITLSTDWRPRGLVVFPFDADGLDLALANLLDNARKYCFFNREVTVGVAIKGPSVLIWVEDVGHPIPAGRELYQPGKRSKLNDPLRIIRGEGLGLAMVNQVVEAHGGSLSHTCTLDSESDDPHTTPWRVRFTIELPHQWKEPRGKND
jgi:signal transduction histidine kinase